MVKEETNQKGQEKKICRISCTFFKS